MKKSIGAQQAATPGSIRVGVAVYIPEVLRSFGLAPEPIVASAGLSMTLLEDADTVIPYIALDRLVSVCVTETRCSHFGLLVGKCGGLNSLGPLGLLIQHAPDVGNALRELVQYLHIHDRGAAPNLEVYQTNAILSYSIYEPRVEAGDHIADGAMAVAFNILKSLCGSNWLPGEINLPRTKPRSVRPFQLFFRAKVTFDSEQAALIFPTKWLGRKLPRADAELHRFIASQLKDQLDSRHMDFGLQVRRVVRTQLINKRVSAAGVSDLFKMHRRTLSWRLKSEGTSFEEILNEMRFEIANQLVADTDLPFSQIAAALNYSEASAFTRAFRRWSGFNPSDWRLKKRKSRSDPRGSEDTVDT